MSETERARQRSFAAFFTTEIAPSLPTLEAQRKGRLRNTYGRVFAAAFVVVVAALIVWLAWHPVAGVVVLFVGATGGLAWARQPAKRHSAAVRDLVVPALLRFLDSVEYHRKVDGRFDLERVRRSGITPPFNSSKLEDLFLGRYRDTDFRMVEARLQRRRSGRRSRRRAVFSGLLCDISVPVAFEGKVLLVGDKGALGNWLGDLLKRNFSGTQPVTLDHAAFEARYHVYSDRPEEARRLLQPGLMESLLALADDLGGQALNCAFIEGRFLMAVPQQRNLFEVGRLHRSLDRAEDDLRRLAAEFTIPHRLIDNLHGERKPLLPEA